MIINNNSNSTDFTEKMQRCQSHIEALEAERKKIQVFERELPLCLELVTQAIEGWRQQMSGTTPDYFNGGQSECSEHTSSEAPVLEEFIFLKRTSSINDQLDEQDSRKDKIFSTSNQRNDVSSKDCDKFSKKSDWLRSVQLCIQTPDPTTTKEDSPRKVSVVEVKKNGGGAFHPFKKEKGCGTAVVTTRTPSPTGDPAAAASSTAETGGSSGGGGGGGCGGGGGGGSKREDKDEQSNRKARRCWSPELHRRFLHSLQQLGGAHVATPKQIRELMKVDGLTNDEVKSHLQKYRLHTRRPSPSIHNSNNGQTPQFVVVGGLWMPPAEYASMTTTASGDAATPNGIYAPIASLPPSIGAAANKRQRSENFHSEERGCSHSEDRTRSNSPTTTSSSTHTTTASPAF